MNAVSGFVARFRQPEYVAENRCIPCTAVNLLVALALSGVIGVATSSLATTTAGLVAAAIAFAAFAAVIYLRGYLVPGTPTLTKRYFPEWFLAAFGKDPIVPDRADGDIDKEAVLVGVNALEECEDGTDLCLVDEFRRTWYDAIECIEAEAAYDELFNIVNVDTGDVTVEEYGSNVQAQVDGRFAGVWKSRAALLADLGAASVLADRFGAWDALNPHERHALLGGLRLFIDECPTCGAVPELGTDTIETCCDARQVTTLDCPGCDARLFETSVTG